MAKLNKEDFISALKEMSILEIKELVDAMKEEFGVDPSAVAVAAGPAVAAAAEDGAGAAEAQSEFTVVLAEIGQEKIKVIKAIREITGLGLKEAKEVVDNAPSNVKENVEQAEADAIKAQLEEVGATVELK